MTQTATVTTVPAIFWDTVFSDKFDGKIYKAIKVNPKNIRSLGMDGKTWNVPWDRTREATPEEVQRFESWQAEQPTPDPELDVPLDATLGTIVEFVDARPKQKGHPADTTGKFVVIGLKADGFKVARLGGDGGRYFPSVKGSHLKLSDA